MLKPKYLLICGLLALAACQRSAAPVSSPATPLAQNAPERVSVSQPAVLTPARSLPRVSPAPVRESAPVAKEQTASDEWQEELAELQRTPLSERTAHTRTEDAAELEQTLLQVQAAVKPASVSLAGAETQAAPPALSCDLACQTESELAQQVPLRQQQWLGSHNAYNDTGIFKNQFWNITQQLDAGARILELDLHTRLFSNQVRVCHGAGSRDCLLNPFGVKDYSRLLQEIRDWSDQHPDQLLIIELENHVKNQKAVLEPLQKTFGSLIYAASERPANWLEQTPAEILARGKRIIVADFGPLRFDGQLIWDQNALSTNLLSKAFSPNCQVNGQPMGEKAWGFYDDKTFSKPKPLTAQSIPPFLACNTRYLKVDRLSPALIQARHFVWESLPEGKRCASRSASSSRWQAESCERVLPVACRVDDAWKISQQAGDWAQGAEMCLREFGVRARFEPPRTYFQNHQLGQGLNATTSPVWLGYRAP